MADDDTGAGSAEQQNTDTAEERKPEGKEQDGKPEGKGKDGRKPEDKKEDEQERKDQFEQAVGDPLADAVGGPSARAGEGQAYRTWMRTVRASGPAAFVSGGNIGVLNITAASGAYDRRSQAPGPVRREVIDEICGRYVPVDEYETFAKQLSNSRLLVLRGAPGTGRTTTGLRLLAKLADSVARFSPDTNLGALTATNLEPQSGYLLELYPGRGIPAPAAAEVDLLRNYLSERECYLVLIAPHDIRYRDCFDGCIVDCPLPDARKVFDQAIEYEIRRRPEHEERLRKIVDVAWTGEVTGPRTPAEVHWLLAHLMSAAATSYATADLELLYADLAARYVSSWFEPLAGLPVTAEGDDPVRLAAFRIALAVLNETPADLVAEAAEDLAQRILTARSPRRKPGTPVFARHREDHAANSRASVVPGAVKFFTGTAPANLLVYDDDRLPLAVLRHVWAVHHLRDPLLSWLEFLSDDPRPLVYVRAALAIGLLTSWDFSYTFHARIEPWARSADEQRRRWVAAVALDEASRNEEVRPLIREIMETWADEGDLALRWTAATALGYDLGLRDPEKTLRQLRKLGCWEDGELASTASWAAARIFVRGSTKPVIKALADWLDDDRSNVRLLGLVAVLRIANMKVNELEGEFDLTDTSAGGRWTRLSSRGRWPLLVALGDEDPALLDDLVDLVWQLTRSAQAEKLTAKALKRWMRAGKNDRTCIGPVGRFLALLGDDDDDRARLLHLVRLLRRDRDEPLPAAIADRYERAIKHNMHTTDEKG